MKLRISTWLQNLGIACSIASLLTLFFRLSEFSWMTRTVYHIPVFFVSIFLVSIVIAEDVRNLFKKLFWYEKRKVQRPIWQVGIGFIFFLTQISTVMVFGQELTQPQLGGMPLFLVFAFMNAFILTVIYEEIFYRPVKIKA
ncbi:DNA polymerase I [Lysinibacillus irui]|uniref:DNA polymerase I n=1 Tax=Lysinibacillus irui TaxID=2998077 RepID=A0AAJ5USC7_9BACI|nr:MULTISPECIES: DNA polymerase I [Lysinibacillus]MEA0555532.1 DNA polymerase I [Lysinibacillus irui]MEA0564916.1 DNA polymerase I [Lysinibacillus irui]MEA0977117.1 DNA polymerase I [Lysinibacillus irui]MEA1043271.1 DNA polymerase I [Lysinibacillus irui]WDV05859.1 DNA polymerase I [Lysinibacillus irui]